MSHPLQAFFGKIPLFSSLTGDELTELIRAIQPVKLGTKDVLFKEGDPGDAAYVVETGRLEVYLERPEGRIHLAELGPNSVLGEITLLDGQKRTATATALEATTLFRLDKQEYDFLRRNLRPVAFKIMRPIATTLCDRLRETNQLITDTLNPKGEETIEDANIAEEKPNWLRKLAFWRNA